MMKWIVLGAFGLLIVVAVGDIRGPSRDMSSDAPVDVCSEHRAWGYATLQDMTRAMEDHEMTPADPVAAKRMREAVRRHHRAMKRIDENGC